jgi:hypothetical protein
MSQEGWAPRIGEEVTLEEVIERAFDYRGNTTVVKTDGAELVGYVFNRDRRAAEPFIQMFDEAGDGPYRIRYSEIATVRFTGKDTAAGKSYQAWAERRERDKARQAAARGEPPRDRHADPDGC